MRTRLPALLLGVLLAGQACGHTSPLLAPVRQIHAFGDSYSDNGESQRLTREMLAKGIAGAQALPGEVYWQGRWSNGPTAVEVLARQLGAQLADHAVGGAKSGADNYYGWMSAYRHTGLAGQVDAYLATLDGKPADGQALHFIFVSANDFFEHEDFAGEQPLEQLAGSSVANIRAAVQRLGEAGARRFLVVSSTDLSVVPAVVVGNRVERAQRYLQAVNASLPIQLAALRKTRGLELSWFDISPSAATCGATRHATAWWSWTRPASRPSPASARPAPTRTSTTSGTSGIRPGACTNWPARRWRHATRAEPGARP